MEKRHHKYFLRFSYTEEVSLTKTDIKEQTICSVDLGINTDAVCTIMQLSLIHILKEFHRFLRFLYENE